MLVSNINNLNKYEQLNVSQNKDLRDSALRTDTITGKAKQNLEPQPAERAEIKSGNVNPANVQQVQNMQHDVTTRQISLSRVSRAEEVATGISADNYTQSRDELLGLLNSQDEPGALIRQSLSAEVDEIENMTDYSLENEEAVADIADRITDTRENMEGELRESQRNLVRAEVEVANKNAAQVTVDEMENVNQDFINQVNSTLRDSSNMQNIYNNLEPNRMVELLK